MMSSRKSYPGLGGHTVTRSEFEDGVLRDNARHGNRLDNEKRYVDKAKKVVVRGYDKESQMLKQKMATNAQRKTTSYFSQTSMPNGTPTKSTTSRASTGRSSRLIPDYEYKQYKMKQKLEQEQIAKAEEDKDQPEEKPAPPQDGGDAADGALPANGQFEVDDGLEESVSTRRTRPTEEFWSNLSAPKNQSNVRHVRERLRKEFEIPKSSKKSSGSTQVPSVHGTRLARK